MDDVHEVWREMGWGGPGRFGVGVVKDDLIKIQCIHV